MLRASVCSVAVLALFVGVLAADDKDNRRIQEGLREAGLDGVVDTLPTNVLLLTGFWPVVGTSIAVCNVVTVTAAGAEVLTPFQSGVEQLALP